MEHPRVLGVVCPDVDHGAVFVLSINDQCSVPYLLYCTVIDYIKKAQSFKCRHIFGQISPPARRKDDEIAIISRVQYRVWWWLRQKNKKKI